MDNLQAQLKADVNNASVYPQDPYDRDIDWARADFDVGRRLCFKTTLTGGRRYRRHSAAD
jgi:hypothetical protein